MAIKPNNNDAFFREVDEELRRDQFGGFWRRYRWPLIVGAVLLLAAIAGFLWWNEHRDAKAGEQGEVLTAAFEDAQARKTDAATAKLNQLTEEGTPGYRAAALLSKAALSVQAGKEAEAIAAYRGIAADADMPQPYRDLALIRQTALEFDRLQPAQIVQRLRPLAIAGNPWFGSAGEMTASAHLRQNRPDLAAPIFAAMAKEESLPASLRSRAVQMAGALGVDAVQDTAATKEVSE